MQSQTTERFWKCFNRLPLNVQLKAKNAYSVWHENQNHPSLNFKQVHPTKSIYSVRIGLNYRAIGVKEESTMIWFWIGTHEEYNNII